MEWKYSIFKGYTLSTTLDSVNLLVPEKRSGVFKPKRGPLPKKGQYAMGVVDEKICGQIVCMYTPFLHMTGPDVVYQGTLLPSLGSIMRR